ncbi:MAG TPA: hypothetical protein VNN22_08005 [Verrucomicrobiae bacterium]|nr:hypothetical protein [Verrucomicrobiae bacterium]
MKGLPFSETDPDFVEGADAVEVVQALELFEEIEAECAATFFRTILFRNVILHESLWLLVIRFHNFEAAHEDGYLIRSWPKKDFRKSVLDDAQKEYAALTGALKLPDKKD